MAWEARSGLKHGVPLQRSQAVQGLNGLGSPFGIETQILALEHIPDPWLNGLGSPFGIETFLVGYVPIFLLVG